MLKRFIPDPRQRQGLFIILVVGLVMRLALMSSDGYTNDISTFEAWTITLRDHGLGGFYSNAGFADYPPGYFYVLRVLAWLYQLVTMINPDKTFAILHFLVKLPGVLSDVVDTVIIYALARRLAPRYALGAAAFSIFNPALIAISAVWGQVDSVAAIGTLVALWLIDGVLRKLVPARLATVGAWLAITASILIKPAPLVLIPLLLVIPLLQKTWFERRSAAVNTLLGIGAAILLSYVASLPCAPVKDPIGCFHWLIARYQYGSNVYPYNSVNAFNLYSIGAPMWQSDSVRTALSLGLPQVVWGAGLVTLCVAAFTVRFVIVGTSQALLEAAMLCSLAFFAFATRMHERYVFNALILTFPLVAISRAYILNGVTLTVTLFLNLIYSLVYLVAVSHPQPGIDGRNLMPALSTSCGFLNVVILLMQGFEFMGLGGLFGDQTTKRAEVDPLTDPQGQISGEPRRPKTYKEWESALAERWSGYFRGGKHPEDFSLAPRRWVLQTAVPQEGLAPFTRRDWLLAAALTLFSFVLCWHQYWVPAEKIFDEIYYARSGAEYLKHIEQYEWTHPPFTKLVITLSMWLFGGIPHGDTSTGWRFLNVIVGALMVGLLYRLVKKISGSTLAATLAASMLVLDGFHFAQSRIATPEITVACLALATITAFYEYWIAAQVRSIPQAKETSPYQMLLTYGAVFLVTLCVALPIALFKLIEPRDTALNINAIAVALFVGYCELGAYLATRWYLLHRCVSRRVMSYPDGSLVVDGRLVVAEGAIPEGMTIVQDGASLAIRAANDPEGAGVRCEADGSLTAISLRDGWTNTLHQATGPRLLLVLACCAGLLGASKWNGLFDLLLIWVIMIAVTLAPSWAGTASELGLVVPRQRATWGNPRGFPLDLTLGLTLFVAASIYMLSYIPYFLGFHHDFVDLVTLQHSMYAYHHDLRATHPYQSSWWQWPLLDRPISYYYHDFRTVLGKKSGSACCVAEILALPNPISWWAGLVSIPIIGWLAWRERRKGYALLFLAYFAQWLPWMASPRIAFEYHFFPNLALICASNGILLERLWPRQLTSDGDQLLYWLKRGFVVVFCLLVIAGFIFWYPIVSGMPTSYDWWHAQVLDWASRYGIHWI